MLLEGVNLDNYGGFWAVEPVRFSQIVDRVNSMNLAAHVMAQEPKKYSAAARHFQPVGGGSIALIDIQGTMTKAGSSLGGGGTVQARHAIRQANSDETVGAILIRFDTPGGTVSGTADLAGDIAKTTKPTIAFVEDLCCSAGMWCASQCDEIFANNATAMVGSIGTFMALHDISGALADMKIRTIVVKAGEFKGGGFPGTEVTDAQVAEWQKQIDAIQAQFTDGIARGRKMSVDQAKALVTGLTYVAEEAVSLKLIDGIKTFDEVVQHLQSRISPKKGPKVMTEPKEAPKAASYKEIVAACPGIDPKNAADALFITSCLKNDLTASEANENWCAALTDRVKAAEEKSAAQATELAELKAAAPKPKGAPAVGTKTDDKGGKSFSGDAVSEWKAAIAAKKASGMNHAKAVSAVNREMPHLREAMLAQSNS